MVEDVVELANLLNNSSNMWMVIALFLAGALWKVMWYMYKNTVRMDIYEKESVIHDQILKNDEDIMELINKLAALVDKVLTIVIERLPRG